MMGERPKDTGSGPRVPLWLLVVLVVIGIIVLVAFFVWDIGDVILLMDDLTHDGLR